MSIFNTLFYQPLLKTLLFFYESVPGGFGMAVILLTVAIKLLLYPLNQKALRSQKTLSVLQPKMEKLKKEHGDNKEDLARETMSAYKEAGINPLSGIFLSLIQIPILLGLYRVFQEVPLQAQINPVFLGVDLSLPNIPIVVVSTLFFFIQMQTTPSPKNLNKGSASSVGGPAFSSILEKQMKYFFPIFIFFVLLKTPSAIGLYLTVSSIFSIMQNKIMTDR